MNAAAVGMLTLIASVSAVYMDVPEQLKGVYQESVAEAQRVSTAGDLKSIAVRRVCPLAAEHLQGKQCQRARRGPLGQSLCIYSG